MKLTENDKVIVKGLVESATPANPDLTGMYRRLWLDQCADTSSAEAEANYLRERVSLLDATVNRLRSAGILALVALAAFSAAWLIWLVR